MHVVDNRESRLRHSACATGAAQAMDSQYKYTVKCPTSSVYLLPAHCLSDAISIAFFPFCDDSKSQRRGGGLREAGCAELASGR